MPHGACVPQFPPPPPVHTALRSHTNARPGDRDGKECTPHSHPPPQNHRQAPASPHPFLSLISCSK
eukprot:scaffold3735_cov59-Isochrysis_galbana.AAC.1